MTATPRAFTPWISGYGTVSPARVWSAIAQISGAINYRNPAFVRGGNVSKGDVLVRIADQDARLALASAEADLDSAEARLEEMRLSEQTTKDTLKIERASLDLAEADLARIERLSKRGVVSDAAVQSEQREVLAQRSKVQSQENSLALLPAQIRAQEQAVLKADIARRSASIDLERTTVIAPFDARVASVDIEISQYVGKGASLGVLDGSEAAEIEVQISQRRLFALTELQVGLEDRAEERPRPAAATRSPDLPRQRGSPATLAAGVPHGLDAQVLLGSDQGSFAWEADVIRISDAVSAETRSLGVILRVPDPYGQPARGGRPPLIKGTFVRVDLSAPPVAGAILVPRSAIRNGKVMIAGPDDRLDFVPVTQIFAFETVAVLAPGSLPRHARIITSDLSPAIEGHLLAPEPDLVAEARLSAAASGGAL
ncbi:MAG: hemolysin D [Pseudomonadota bacterium]